MTGVLAITEQTGEKPCPNHLKMPPTTPLKNKAPACGPADGQFTARPKTKLTRNSG